MVTKIKEVPCLTQLSLERSTLLNPRTFELKPTKNATRKDAPIQTRVASEYLNQHQVALYVQHYFKRKYGTFVSTPLRPVSWQLVFGHSGISGAHAFRSPKGFTFETLLPVILM